MDKPASEARPPYWDASEARPPSRPELISSAAGDRMIDASYCLSMSNPAATPPKAQMTIAQPAAILTRHNANRSPRRLMASGGGRYEVFWSIADCTDETRGAVP